MICAIGSQMVGTPQESVTLLAFRAAATDRLDADAGREIPSSRPSIAAV
jgi:hypothetical protein